MATGYFILPRVGSGTQAAPWRPKYLYETDGRTLRPGVDGFNGSETIEKPAGSGNYYIAAMVMATDSQLSTLEAQSDAYRLNPSVLTNALNQTGELPIDLSGEEWAFLFHHFVGGV